MFRILFYTDDKRLARVHHALVGLVIGQPQVTVVTHAQIGANGQLVRAEFDMAEFFKGLPMEFRTKDIEAALRSQGRSHYSSVVAKLVKDAIAAKLIRKRGKTRGQFTRL